MLKDLTPVSKFKVKLECGCPGGPYRRTVKFLYFSRIMTKHLMGTLVFVTHPAMRRFDDNTLQFDEDFWETEEDEDEDSRDLVRPVENHICPNCMQGMHVLDVEVPESTWVLVVEVTKDHVEAGVTFKNFPGSFAYSGARYKKAWVSYLQDGRHFISVHRVDGHWYLYDDLDSNPKLTRIPDTLKFRAGIVPQRVFYYRDTSASARGIAPNQSPHRCLEFANATDQVEGIRTIAQSYPANYDGPWRQPPP